MHFRKHFAIYAWLLAVGILIRAGFVPDDYAIHNHIPVPAYPLVGVLMFAAIAALECFVLAKIIRVDTFSRSFDRLVSAFLVFLVLLVVWGFALMHSSPVYAGHVVWLLIVWAALLLVMLASITAWLVVYLRSR
jgi:hypothetical protein